MKKSEKQRRKEKICPFECRVPKNSKERLKKKPSSVITAKKQRKRGKWEKLEIFSRKLEIPREDFVQKWAQ